MLCFFDIKNERFCRLQSAQNAAARLVTGAKRSDHISPVLRSSAALVAGPAARGVQDSEAHPPILYRSFSRRPCWWLSACHRRSSKVLLTRGHCLSTEPPAASGRTFAAAATRLWNSLPADLRNAVLSYSRFKRSLKTFLFRQSDHGVLWTFRFLTAPYRNIRTCFLTILI